MTEDRKNTEQPQDVKGHGFRGWSPSEQPQDVEGHAYRYGGAPSEEAQDVEGHVLRAKWQPSEEAADVEPHGLRGMAHEDTPPAKPGTEGRDDDVEGHQVRSGR